MEIFHIESYSRPCKGEHRNGDLIFARAINETCTLLALADMAGHGDAAYRDSLVIKRWLISMSVIQPVKLVRDLHTQLLNSRHASLIVGVLNSDQNSLRYVHIGNLHGKLESENSKILTGQEGSVGLNLPRVELRKLSFELGDRLILCTDGVAETWASSPALVDKNLNPRIQARDIVQRYGKPHDDASCIIVTAN